MTITIAGGSVTYKRNIKVADYEGKTAEVTLSFGAPDGGDVSPEALQGVGAMAMNQAHVMLGLATPLPTAAAAVAASDAPRRGRPPRVISPPDTAPDPLAAAGGSNTVVTTGGQAASSGAADPLAGISSQADQGGTSASAGSDDPLGTTASDGAPAAGAASGSTSDATVASDPLGGDLLSGIAPTITDADLTAWITETNSKTKNSLAIRKLIGVYAPPPGHASKIPQEKRQAFLDELAKVGPA